MFTQTHTFTQYLELGSIETFQKSKELLKSFQILDFSLSLDPDRGKKKKPPSFQICVKLTFSLSTETALKLESKGEAGNLNARHIRSYRLALEIR